MKRILRLFLINTATIYALVFLNPGFSYSGGYRTLILAAFIMLFINFILEPILSIIFIPINFVTLGIFSWLLSVGLFYALVFFVPAIKVAGWHFPGLTIPLYTFYTLNLPSYNFNFITNLILLAFSFNLISNCLKWLCD